MLSCFHIGESAIVMFDVTSWASYQKAFNYQADQLKIFGRDFPIFLAGNKVDIKDRKVKFQSIQKDLQVQFGFGFVSVSCV